MRRLIELNEQIDEVNYFLNEWQHLKQYKNARAKSLQGPEVRFITRTIERLIHEAELLDIPLVLELKTATDAIEPSNSAEHTQIPLTECYKMTNDYGENVAYVGNGQGLLSIAKVAEMVSRGSRLVLVGLDTSV